MNKAAKVNRLRSLITESRIAPEQARGKHDISDTIALLYGKIQKRALHHLTR